MMFLPVFRWRGLRWRVRVRLVRSWRWRIGLESYPEGLVWQVRRGPLLLTAMVDG